MINQTSTNQISDFSIVIGFSSPIFTLIGVALGAYLNERFSAKRFALQSLQVYSRQFDTDRELRRTTDKIFDGKRLTENEISRYVNFFEEICLFLDQGIFQINLVDELFGSFMLAAHNTEQVQKYIRDTRMGEKDPPLFAHFENAVALLGAQSSSGRTGAKVIASRARVPTPIIGLALSILGSLIPIYVAIKFYPRTIDQIAEPPPLFYVGLSVAAILIVSGIFLATVWPTVRRTTVRRIRN